MTTFGDATFDEATLGDRIRHAFDGYALPAPTARPISAPRRRTRHWLAPVAVAAVALLLAVPVVTAPAPVFATWTPTPGAQDAAVVAAVAASCTGDHLTADAPVAEQVYQAQLNALPLAVVDQRGRAAMLFYAERRADGIATNLCLGAVDQWGTYLGGGSGGGLGGIEEPADGPIRIVSGVRNTRHGPDIWTIIRGGDAYTAYAGTITSDVARVVVQRNEGVAVTASIDDGFFAAWWPGTAHATSFEAFDAEGELIASLANEDWTFPD